ASPTGRETTDAADRLTRSTGRGRRTRPASASAHQPRRGYEFRRPGSRAAAPGAIHLLLVRAERVVPARAGAARPPRPPSPARPTPKNNPPTPTENTPPTPTPTRRSSRNSTRGSLS